MKVLYNAIKVFINFIFKIYMHCNIGSCGVLAHKIYKYFGIIYKKLVRCNVCVFWYIAV